MADVFTNSTVYGVGGYYGYVTAAQVAGILNGQNLGTPSAITLTNGTSLPISTGVSGLGTGVGTALGVAANTSGGIYTFGSGLSVTTTTTPTPAAGALQLTGIATAPTMGANGEGWIGLSSTGGMVMQSKGSLADWTLNNSAGTNVCSVSTGTTALACGVYYTGGAYTLAANASYAMAAKFAVYTAPTVQTGFGTGDAISNANGTISFEEIVGTGTIGTSVALTFPAASHKWRCTASDLTTNSITLDQSASTTTLVTMKSYSRTTGLASAPTAGDDLIFGCLGN